ncbi:sugar phosphate isomerase/epimerase family protein [Deefgea rivuli]|uniref:sugar phosphate isomerase/epimerase family protein n=1 Tax=Deefgea rivuli TaxID=400948 RepID=UPI000489CC89|nr:sugar phosphate isomerase/epimerase [Deefgea rivuli]
MRLGCATRPYQALTLPHACEHIAAAGFTEVALFYNQTQDGAAIAVTADSTAPQIAAARQACDAAGLLPSLLLAGEWQVAGGQAAALDRYRRLIENTQQLGASMLLDFGCEHADLLPDYIALMQAIEPVARAANITICIKPHGGISTQPLHLIALKQILTSDVFMLSFDPGNLLYYSAGQIQPEDYIDALAPYCANFIIKDYQLTPSGPSVAVTPGEGEVDFLSLIRSLHTHQFNGPLYLELVAGAALPEIDRNVRRSQQRMTSWHKASKTEFTSLYCN